MGFEDFETFFVEVVEVGVSDHDEVDERHEFEVESWFALAFDDAVPVGPVGVDDDGVVGKLDEEGGVADPGDADFAFVWGVRDGFVLFAVTFLKHLG